MGVSSTMIKNNKCLLNHEKLYLETKMNANMHTYYEKAIGLIRLNIISCLLTFFVSLVYSHIKVSNAQEIIFLKPIKSNKYPY
jgi:hypothetical protein